MKSTRSIDDSRFQRSLCAFGERLALIVLLLQIEGAVASAKTRPNDAMGAHVNSGRGCVACHASHGGLSIEAASSAPAMLWGDNVTATYAISGGGPFKAPSDDRFESRGVLSCLSCHDGNYAPRAMMRNVVYESTPASYGVGHVVPTLLEKDDFNGGNNIDDHPIGSAAQLRCGGAMGWDCQQSFGAIRMQGTLSSKFAANYGFFVQPVHCGNTSIVSCTTCHNPHSMTWTAVTASTASSLYPAGEYPTKHFLRAPSYDVEVTSSTSNQGVQFCRQCHADKSNEMNGSLAGTL